MSTTVETLPNCQATLTVQVAPERLNKARETVVLDFLKQARLPGFRPGKAPRKSVEDRFSKEITEERNRIVINETSREAIAETKLRVLSISGVQEVEFDKDAPSYKVTVVTEPQFDLPVYKGLVVPMTPTEVSDEDVEKSINELREQYADYVDLAEDRPAAMEDFVVVDYDGTIDGKPVNEVFPKAGKPLTTNKDFWIKMTEEAFFPGYCQAIVGAKPGETRSFEITVPADFPVEGMPGAKISYTVKLNAIKVKVLPELDDKWAAEVAKGKTIAELREMARTEIGRQKRGASEAGKRSSIMKQLIEKVECELPESLVKAHTQTILNEIVSENQERGVAEEVIKENQQELVGVASTGARDRIKGSFILLRIAQQEGITVTQEELLGRIASMAQRYQMPFEKMVKELQKRNAVPQIHEDMLTAKTLDFLVANSSVTTVGA